MVFNVVVIIGFVLQGLIIFWLLSMLYKSMQASASIFAYMQAMAMDLGYPPIIGDEIPDNNDELKDWCAARKKDGET